MTLFLLQCDMARCLNPGPADYESGARTVAPRQDVRAPAGAPGPS